MGVGSNLLYFVVVTNSAPGDDSGVVLSMPALLVSRAGVPLVEYAGVSPQNGIKTGCNEAFLIDTPTRDAMVAADPGCADAEDVE